MMNLDVFRFELKHFVNSKAKMFSYLFFMILCVFSIHNGFEIMQKQVDTITDIREKQEFEVLQVFNWFDNKQNGRNVFSYSKSCGFFRNFVAISPASFAISIVTSNAF